MKFAVLFASGLFACLVASGAEARPADCLVEIEGKARIDGQCDFDAQPNGDFTLKSGRRTTNVMVDPGSRTGRASYEDPQTKESTMIGDVNRDGACWKNKWGRVCAWGIGERPAGFGRAAAAQPAPQPARQSGEPWVPQRDGAVDPRSRLTGSEANGEPLYVCAAHTDSGLHPGKVRKGFGGCNIADGGREVTVPRYYVYVGPGRWGAANRNPGSYPKDAVEGGSDSTGTPLYPCRAAFKGGEHLGQATKNGGCNFSYGGKEQWADYYDVIIGGGAPAPAAAPVATNAPAPAPAAARGAEKMPNGLFRITNNLPDGWIYHRYTNDAGGRTLVSCAVTKMTGSEEGLHFSFGKGANRFSYSFSSLGTASDQSPRSVKYWWNDDQGAAEDLAVQSLVEHDDYAWLGAYQTTSEPGVEDPFMNTEKVSFTYRMDGADHTATFPLKGSSKALQTLFDCGNS